MDVLLQLLVGFALCCVAITVLFFTGAAIVVGAAKVFGRPLGWIVSPLLESKLFGRAVRTLIYVSLAVGVLSYAFTGDGWYLALAAASFLAAMADAGAF